MEILFQLDQLLGPNSWSPFKPHKHTQHTQHIAVHFHIISMCSNTQLIANIVILEFKHPALAATDL